ncbi:MAG: hypothetical protein JWP36_2430 [Paucimonas sp.]|nr:hypothetical protein [Paucimonas sp.]
MATASPSFQQPRTLTGIGVSLAVHVVLVGLWQLSRPLTSAQDSQAQRVQLLRLLPAPVPDRSDAPPPPAVRGGGPPAAPAWRRPSADRAPATPLAGAIPLPAPQAADAPPAAPGSGADLLRDARAAAGAIDRALRAENPERGLRAPIDTAQMKLEKGIARAGEMAPNKWYQAPKTQEILDPGGYGRRRHRVITAAGAWCLTYESNHAPDGIDSMQHGIKPKLTSCDEDEQPATRQKWN